MISEYLNDTVCSFPHHLPPFFLSFSAFLPPARFRLLADARACTHWSTHAHKIHSLEKPSQQFGPGV